MARLMAEWLARKLDLSLAANEQRYRELYENSPDMFLTTNLPGGEIADCNATLCRRLGYQKSELIGLPYHTIYPPEHLADAPRMLSAFSATGQFVDVERQLRQKDGALLDVSLSVHAIRDAKGAITGSRAVFRDISRRKREDRDRTEQRFRSFIDAVDDYAIFMLDADGKIATWNNGAERMKGYRAAEVIGKPISIFYTPADLEREHPRFELEEARTTGRYQEEGWRVRKDGTRFWAHVTITALKSPEGRLEGFAKITRDITERRRYEEELHAKQAALTQSLKERGVLLQEVHHRVKNNLQVISSLINMQARRLEDGSTRDALTECQTRVLTIALIHEKLYQSKDYAEVPFADYVRSLASNVLHATGLSPGKVRFELAIEEVSLGVDRAIPCGLVINELMTNSLKHAFKNDRAGKLRVELLKLPDGKLRLSVDDDGPGLPAGFDLEGASSMGLQLVRTLAAQLDAQLVVEGDRGASFQLTFS